MAFTEKSRTFERLDDHCRRAHRVGGPAGNGRYVVLSDAHKWDGGPTDFFKRVEPVYLGALDHYHAQDFTLVLLGDIEEGAGDRLADVVDRNPATFAGERKFFPGRYLRVYGNHDHDWKRDEVRRKLDAVMGAPVPVYPALQLGEKILVVHGHEGDLFSDELHGFTQVLLRFFKRSWEQLLGKSPSAAENSKLRSRRAQLLYEWGESRRTLVIAGHTHLAYFESVSLTRIMTRRIRDLEQMRLRRVQAGEADIHSEELARAQRHRAAHDRFFELDESLADDALPLYFNSGCCKYSDGLTAIEISDGRIALAKWTLDGGTVPARTELGSRRLTDVLQRIPPP